jgi:micrococcal nuclease
MDGSFVMEPRQMTFYSWGTSVWIKRLSWIMLHELYFHPRVLFIYILIGLSIHCVPFPSIAQDKKPYTFTGKVADVISGNEIVVYSEGVNHVITLYGIECPTSEHAFGSQARRFTLGVTDKKTVIVKVIERPRKTPRDPVFGDVLLPDGKMLNQELLKVGLAWWDRGSKDKVLEQLESEARKARVGLWEDNNPVPPWEWRKKKEQEVVNSFTPEDRAAQEETIRKYYEHIDKAEWEQAYNLLSKTYKQSHNIRFPAWSNDMKKQLAGAKVISIEFTPDCTKKGEEACYYAKVVEKFREKARNGGVRSGVEGLYYSLIKEDGVWKIKDWGVAP